MKAFKFFSFLFVITFFSASAFAININDNFRIDFVKPYGEYGFRVMGKGKNITELKLDCSQVSEMGLVIGVVNEYGKSSIMVLPAQDFGADKIACQQNLKKYFAGVYSKRGIANLKHKAGKGMIKLNIARGGFLENSKNDQMLVLR